MNVIHDYMNLPQVKFMIEHWEIFVSFFAVVIVVLFIVKSEK